MNSYCGNNNNNNSVDSFLNFVIAILDKGKMRSYKFDIIYRHSIINLKPTQPQHLL